MLSMEELDIFVSGLVYLASVFVLLFVGKLVYNLLHRGYDLKHELFQNDNFALSLAVVGYYMGLVMALGGVLSADSAGLVDALIGIGIYGGLAIVLLNVSAFLNERIILRKFDKNKEIITDRNAGTGAIEGGHHIANGLIISGVMSGEGGNVLVTLAFWGLGQVALIIMAEIYSALRKFDVHKEIETRDNVAVGVAFAGLLVATGNIVRLSVTGSFEGWAQDIVQFAVYFAMGVVLLPVVRFVTDFLLVSNANLDDEMVGQEKPNVGAGVLEAFSYVAGSMLIGWVIF